MTREQADWLGKNKPYRALGQPPGFGARYVKVGMLHPDGTFELRVRGQRSTVREGSFEVGVLEVNPNPGMQQGPPR